MSSDDELAERGRAIFERLRGAASTDEDLPATLDAGGGPDDGEGPQSEGDSEVVAEHEPTPASAEDASSALEGAEPFQPVHDVLAVGVEEAGPGATPDAEPGDEPLVEGEDGGAGQPSNEDPSTDDTAVESGDGLEPAAEAAEPVETPPVEEPAPDTDVAPPLDPPSTPSDAPPVNDVDGEPAPAAATVESPAPAAAPHSPGDAEPTRVTLPAGDVDLAAAASVSRGPTDGNPFARPLPRVMAIANQKGGVGKTTTAVNLGAALAELGYRVLVVDLDPQGNATTGLGINPRNLEASVYDVIMHDTPLEDCIEPTSLRNLFVVPATIDLAGAEIELVPAFSRELKLRRALDTVLEDFDFALIDCPPSLGLITVNGLAAATEVVVPIQCEYYALEGLGQLLRNVNLVQGNLNPRLEVSAIILTMYDARTKLADQVANEVRSHFGTKVCRNIVPRTVRLSEAPSFGQPIIVFDPSSRGAIAYRELAKEVSGGAPQRVG